jgi:NAD-dependent dihydropyrimidine dehydrogenase PreA subunit
MESISMKDGLAVVDPDTCGDCGACVDACPVEAISLE